MKFKIDTRYIVLQSLKAIVGYLFGVFIVLYFLDVKAPLEFVGTSLFACIVLYFAFTFPKKIIINDGIIYFAPQNSMKKYEVQLADIVKTEYSRKKYNTVIIFTKSGAKHELHPKDAKTFINALHSHEYQP